MSWQLTNCTAYTIHAASYETAWSCQHNLCLPFSRSLSSWARLPWQTLSVPDIYTTQHYWASWKETGASSTNLYIAAASARQTCFEFHGRNSRPFRHKGMVWMDLDYALSRFLTSLVELLLYVSSRSSWMSIVLRCTQKRFLLHLLDPRSTVLSARTAPARHWGLQEYRLGIIHGRICLTNLIYKSNKNHVVVIALFYAAASDRPYLQWG
jgi:hypothetical protein